MGLFSKDKDIVAECSRCGKVDFKANLRGPGKDGAYWHRDTRCLRLGSAGYDDSACCARCGKRDFVANMARAPRFADYSYDNCMINEGAWEHKECATMHIHQDTSQERVLSHAAETKEVRELFKQFCDWDRLSAHFDYERVLSPVGLKMIERIICEEKKEE